jgi:cell division septation protein DedD
MTLRITIFLLFLSSCAWAQYPSSFIHSNYGGVQSMLFNPALVADSRLRTQVQLASFYVNAQNNYIQVQTPFNQLKGLQSEVDPQYLDENGYTVFERGYTQEKLNGKKKFASVQAEVQGPAFLHNTQHYGTFGFSMRTRAFAHLSGIDENLLKIFAEDADTTALNWNPNDHQLRVLNQALSQGNMSAGAVAFQQFGFTYAHTANTRPKNQWSYGVSVHYLIGLGAAQLDVESLDYQLLGTDSLALNNVDVRASYTRGDYFTDANARKLLGSNKLGSGMTIDIGFSYEWRPDYKRYRYKMDRKSHEDPTVNKYVLKAAASITDFGRIKFDNFGATKRYNLYSEEAVTWSNFNSIQNVTSEEKLDSFFFALFPDSDTTSKFISRLPTSLNLLLDYQIMPRWYLGANYVHSLRTRGVDGMRKANRLTVHTRYEGHHIEAGLQLTVRNSYSPVQTGAYVRMGPVYIGTEHLSTFLLPRKTSAINVYGGVVMPLYKKRIKDTDMDGCSDAKDRCPEEPGDVYAKGCPDTDQDQVADYEDECPFTYGSVGTKGCPDRDEDGIADKLDSCVNEFGYAKYNGCPDQSYASTSIKTAASKEDQKPDIHEEKGVDLAEVKEGKNVPEPVSARPMPADATPEELIAFMDFTSYEYYLIFGAFKNQPYAENLKNELYQIGISTRLKYDQSKKLYYVAMGPFDTQSEAKNAYFTTNTPSVLGIINGHLWWKKWDRL